MPVRDKLEESCRASRQAHISSFTVKLEPSSLPTSLWHRVTPWMMKQTRNSSMSQERTVFQSSLRVGLSGFPSGVWFSCLASDWDRRAVRQKVDREWASLRHIIFTEALPGAGRDSKLELTGRVPMKAVPLGREWWEKKVPEKEWAQRHPSSCCPMVLQGALWSLCGSAGPNPLF